ncbi:molybdopterin-guanine dinucleotide biosynthesis protein B [Methanospirillum hungatei]|uniref:molybdopterin-guanine dinucleotide biosynthesis protein B n=1 Tax=Methanospirillum hungatei TaxID=2203 RepID=UPI0026EDDC9F|nr:molybdopterin-guanine dinucleotide biosynthesis protein B [Methanospirillum hungatei]MCA1916072.1 molybdopterin-guanine dinucleotide biosynthesis protein B [Methanospirillum hungatei]
MKVIHIAGWSGSGKTTFILDLCSHLVHHGRTATIKHIGSHYCVLPLGKDTTLHFEAGANPAIGVDEEKTSATFHSTSLDDALNLLSDSGIRYAIIEGFKKRPFQKVVIGDLEGTSLVKDPETHEVLAVLDQFDDWYTLAGLMKELMEECMDCQIFSWAGYTSDYPNTTRLCSHIEEQYAGDHRISGIRARVQKWADDNRYPVYLVMAMPAHHDDVEVFSEAFNLLRPCLQS